MLPGRWSSSCGFCWVFSFFSFGGTTFLKNKPEKLLISCGCAQRFALFFLLACLFLPARLGQLQPKPLLHVILKRSAELFSLEGTSQDYLVQPARCMRV